MLTGSWVMRWQWAKNCEWVDRNLWMRKDHIRKQKIAHPQTKCDNGSTWLILVNNFTEKLQYWSLIFLGIYPDNLSLIFSNVSGKNSKIVNSVTQWFILVWATQSLHWMDCWCVCVCWGVEGVGQDTSVSIQKSKVGRMEENSSLNQDSYWKEIKANMKIANA